MTWGGVVREGKRWSQKTIKTVSKRSLLFFGEFNQEELVWFLSNIPRENLVCHLSWERSPLVRNDSRETHKNTPLTPLESSGLLIKTPVSWYLSTFPFKVLPPLITLTTSPGASQTQSLFPSLLRWNLTVRPDLPVYTGQSRRTWTNTNPRWTPRPRPLQPTPPKTWGLCRGRVQVRHEMEWSIGVKHFVLPFIRPSIPVEFPFRSPFRSLSFVFVGRRYSDNSVVYLSEWPSDGFHLVLGRGRWVGHRVSRPEFRIETMIKRHTGIPSVK